MTDVVVPPEALHCRSADGGKFYPLHPEKGGLTLRAAVHALARICRFNGHLDKPYSVAQHCVLVSRDAEAVVLAQPGAVTAPMEYAARGRQAGLEGLGHDLDEAAVGDMTTPCKVGFPEFKELEHRWEKKLQDMLTYRCNDYPPSLVVSLPCVKSADRVRLAVDRRDLVNESDWYLGLTSEELLLATETKAGRAWGYRRAEREWLVRYEELSGYRLYRKTKWWQICRFTDIIVGGVLG